MNHILPDANANIIRETSGKLLTFQKSVAIFAKI